MVLLSLSLVEVCVVTGDTRVSVPGRGVLVGWASVRVWKRWKGCLGMGGGVDS